jgi:hypothetical protein
MGFFQPVERRIKGALLDLQRAPGELLDAEENAVAVERAEGDSFKDEEIETAGKKFSLAHDALS